MVNRYYAVRDALACANMCPMPLANDEVALRALKQAANDPEQFKDNKEDIQLWYLFSLDTETGVVSDNTPYCIGSMANFMKVEEDK